MTDFLDRLAARAIGSEAALTPRLPSLFEPASTGSALATGRPGDAPADRPEPVMGDGVPDPDVRMRASEPPPATDPSPRSPGSARRDQATTTAFVAAPDRPHQARHGSPLEPSDTGPILAEGSRQVAQVRTVGGVDASRVQTGDAGVTTRPRQGLVDPLSAGAALRPPALADTSTAGPSMRSAGTPLRRIPAGSTKAQASASVVPEVHVSIGRLEVRAAPMPAVRSPRRDAPAQNGLDDYLRQRGDKAAR